MATNEGAITWEESRRLTTEILENLSALTDDKKEAICGQDGIVAVAYLGNELGFGLRQEETPKIIFVAAAGEDARRHFYAGRTGYSTIRRSLTALLWNRYDLVPIPRSQDESDLERFSNYAIDEASDEKLDQWMAENLQVALLPLPSEQVASTLAGLIAYNAPLLNLQNNPENKYGAEIKLYRKKCEEAARAYAE